MTLRQHFPTDIDKVRNTYEQAREDYFAACKDISDPSGKNEEVGSKWSNAYDALFYATEQLILTESK